DGGTPIPTEVRWVAFGGPRDGSRPCNLMNFCLDNVVGGGKGEYSPGRMVLIRLYSGVPDADQVAVLARDPFAGLTVPEPSSQAQQGLGTAGLIGLGRRRYRAA